MIPDPKSKFLKFKRLFALFLFLSLTPLFFAQSVTFNFTGSVQSWTVPPCVYNITVTAAGAVGGEQGPSDAQGGMGAVVTATIPVTPGATIGLIVGGPGGCPQAGYNGGGIGYNTSPGTLAAYGSCGGGGATNVSVNGTNVIIAAGGGGAGGGSVAYNNGGNGGCATGSPGVNTFGAGGGGGTQSSGGAGGTPWAGTPPGGYAGSLGQGGNGGPWQTASGGGGGGGYYGGGGGGNDGCCTGGNGGGGGGGGSSLVPAGAGCVAGGNNGPGYVTITYTGGSPAATASNTGPYCGGQTIQLNATGGGTYSWTGPGGFTSNLQNPSIPNSSPSNAGTYTVTVNNGGCIATATTSVSVTAMPTVNAVSNQSLCAGSTTTAINFTGSAGTTFNWTNNNTNSGLPASGSGNIAAFTALNTTANPIVSSVTVTPVNGACTGTPMSFTITVNPMPTVDPVAPQSLCAGSSTNPIAFSGNNPGAVYNWTNSNATIGVAASGAGNIAAFVGQNSTANPITGNFVVTPTIFGCTGTSQNFAITINPMPTVDPVADQTLCAGSSTTAINFTGTGGGTYNWTNSNTNTGLAASGTGNIAAFTAQNMGANPITSAITVIPSAGSCVGTGISFNITVNPMPTVNPIVSQTVCVGDLVTAINFSGNNPSTVYSWSNSEPAIGLPVSGNGNISSFAGQNGGLNTLTASISVTPSLNTCIGSTQNFTIAVSPIPTIDPVMDQTYCAGTATTGINFTGSAGATYNWVNSNNSIGLGSSGNGSIPSFVAQNGGGNTIMGTITVTPTAGICTGSSIDFDFIINPMPTVNPQSNQVLCVNESTIAVNFSGNNQSTLYSWSNSNPSIGLGASGTGSIASFIGQNSTANPIIGNMIVTPSLNGCTGTAQNFSITVNPLPVVSAGADQTVCEGTGITLSASGANSYSWSGNVTQNTPFQQAPGIVNYVVTGTDLNGCVNSDNVNVTVNANPTVDAGQDQEICVGESVVLMGNGATSYVWTNGVSDGIAFTPAVGSINYTVTGTDANGCTDTDIVNVTVNALPNVFAGADMIVCEGESITLSATGAQTYVWDNGVSNGISFIPAVSNTYTVVGTDQNGCIASDALLVTVESMPVVSFYATETQGCEPLAVTLINTTPGNLDDCLWTLSNGDSYQGCQPITLLLDAGNYSVTLETTSSNGCTNEVSYPNYIYVEAMPTADFSPSSYILSSFEPDVTFTNNSIGASTYQWDFGDGSGSAEVNPDHSYPTEVEMTYQVQLIAISPIGCTDTIVKEVSVAEELIYYIPNTFTPDGDVFNQSFKPIFTSGHDPYNFSFYIFNRWGEIIWESHDPNVGWDGTYGSANKFGICPNGIYTWKADFKIRKNDQRMEITGHVNLTR